jgi:hypothetical protein
MLMLLRKMFGKVHFKEIKYFSPDGKSMPNGIGIQRGGFLHECMKNKEAFEIDQSICMAHNNKREYLGGIIVFSTDTVADSLVCDYLQHIIPPIAYSIGNAFRGQYVGSSGELYNKDSLTIVVNGMTTKRLLKLAEMLSKTLHPTGIIVKDLNTMKIYTTYEDKTK